MLCFCSVGNLVATLFSQLSSPVSSPSLKPGVLVLGLGDVTVICYQERRTEELPAPTVATLTSSSHISGARACGSLCSQRPLIMQTRMHTCIWITSCFWPSGPLPSHFPVITWAELGRNVLHGRGGGQPGGVSLLSGFR